MQEFKYPNGEIASARQFVSDGQVVPKAFLLNNADNPERLAEVDVMPVRRNPFAGDPNTQDPGVPVETEDNGWIVISYPAPIAKEQVWNKQNREHRFISAGAALPPGYTRKMPAFGRYSTWDTQADDWAEDTIRMGKDVREQRGQLLAESDWTQLNDSQLTPEEMTAWTVYRQALRDIPQQPDFPKNVNWPLEPHRNDEPVI